MEQRLDLFKIEHKYQVDPKYTRRLYTEQEVRDAILETLTYSPNYQPSATRNLDIADKVIKSLNQKNKQWSNKRLLNGFIKEY